MRNLNDVERLALQRQFQHHRTDIDPSENKITVDYQTQGNFTTARVVVANVPKKNRKVKRFICTGVAKRNPKDTNNETSAQLMALGRALLQEQGRIEI